MEILNVKCREMEKVETELRGSVIKVLLFAGLSSVSNFRSQTPATIPD